MTFLFCRWFTKVVFGNHYVLILSGSLKSLLFYCVQMGKALVDHGHDVTIVTAPVMKISSYLTDTDIQFDSFHMDHPLKSM